MDSKTIDKYANIAFIAVCVVVAVVAVLHYANDLERKPRKRPPDYRIGDVLESIPGLTLRADKNLVLYVRSSCQFCTASMPFYRQLTQATGRGYAVIALSTDTQQELEGYLRSYEVQADELISVRAGTLHARGTPTLFVIDRQRRITGYWEGQLREAGEREVEAAIAGS